MDGDGPRERGGRGGRGAATRTAAPRIADAHAETDVSLAEVARGRRFAGWRRAVPPLVFLLALGSACVALARPHVVRLEQLHGARAAPGEAR